MANRSVESGKTSPGWRGYTTSMATTWLLFGAIIILLAFVMRIGSGRTVYLPGASSPVPELCWLAKNFGMDCPGCGLTRGFIHLSHGRLRDAVALNPLSVFWFAFFVAQVFLGFSQVVLRRRDRWIERWTPWNERVLLALALGLCIQWVIRNAGVF